MGNVTFRETEAHQQDYPQVEAGGVRGHHVPEGISTHPLIETIQGTRLKNRVHFNTEVL